MWVFTQDGFISVVDNHQRKGFLTARSRDRQSLIAIAEIADCEIEFTPMRDYQYRTFVTREQYSEWLALQSEMLDYGNFKDQVHKTLGDTFYHACGEVWHAMNMVQDDEATQWARERYATKA